jgi:aspartate kinase
MKDIKIFKVGGSILSEPSNFLEIAKRISRFKDSKICIVTSAMKGKTDELIRIFLEAVPHPDFWNFERFAGLGEVQAAILFEATFSYINVKSKAILPWMEEWPLHISLKSRAQLSEERVNEQRNFSLLEKSKRKIREYLLPLLEKDVILIIPGFIARDGRKRMLTVGRGGSDISAVLIAELLAAKELILLKDVEGVLRLDPRNKDNNRRIKSLNSNELGVIASSGAQIIHPISLKHRINLRNIKIMSANQEFTEKSGTEINFEKEITVKTSDTAFAVLTIIGEKIPESPEILSNVSRVLAENKISIYSISISDNLIAIYVEEKKAESAYRLISSLIAKMKNLKALNLKRNISKIVARSLKFIGDPGIIKKIVTPISREGVHIWKLLTTHTDVVIFIETKDLKRTYSIISQTLRGV